MAHVEESGSLGCGFWDREESFESDWLPPPALFEVPRYYLLGC